jgi:hypothetical protein
MTTANSDRLVATYRRQLVQELSSLPRGDREEILGDIDAHIRERRAALPTQDEASVHNLLDAVGAPADIAADARERLGVPDGHVGALEITALLLLIVGAPVMPLVAPLGGLICVGFSRAWSRRDKLIRGVAPIAVAALLSVVYTAFAGLISGYVIVAALILSPLISGVLLWQRLGRRVSGGVVAVVAVAIVAVSIFTLLALGGIAAGSISSQTSAVSSSAPIPVRSPTS